MRDPRATKITLGIDCRELIQGLVSNHTGYNDKRRVCIREKLRIIQSEMVMAEKDKVSGNHRRTLVPADNKTSANKYQKTCQRKNSSIEKTKRVKHP